jgi:hypothetical protein
MYIHTHSAEKCNIDKPAELAKMLAELQEANKKAGVKMLAACAAPHEHTMYVMLEANDIVALERALTPMTKWGDADLIPAVTMEQWLAPAK